ncbi:hypothetical protein [Microbacterium paludicola]|nr:hypothetical protein [Microbacterium paludicola]MBF0816251.1 hypothetical protein [Microbacterium paludicola]
MTWPELKASFTPAEVRTLRRPLMIRGLERAAGLRPSHFQVARRRHLLFTVCHHYGWSRGRCGTCDLVDSPRSGCRRCAPDAPTTIFTRGGAVCVRHRRWRHDGNDIGVSHLPAYAHAEAMASGWLWFHGVTLHTGEIDLATTLVTSALTDDDGHRRQHRLAQLGLDDGDPAATPLLLYYPEIMHLACALTDRAVASALCTHRESQERQVEMLIGLTAGACDGAPTSELAGLAVDQIERTRAALQEAFSMPSSKRARVRRAPRPKAMIEAAYRHDAPLLRHVDEVRVHAPAVTDVKHPSGSRTVSRRIQVALNRQDAGRSDSSASRIIPR